MTDTAVSGAGTLLESMREAAEHLAGVAVRTPLLDAPALAERAGVPVWIKPELLQPMKAFKARGAYTAIRRLGEAGRANGVVTQSSGNHGQAVAWAAQKFGIRAVVVMPESTPKVKVDGVRSFGGEVVFAGKVRGPEQPAEAERLGKEQGLAMIPPFDHPDVIAGQGTIGLEIAAQAPEALATVLVPVSGGGLIAGISAALGALRPDVEVVGVEPEGSAKLTAALAAGGPSPVASPTSMADGLLARQIGDVTWPVVRRHVRRAVTVTEEEIGAAVKLLYHSMGLVVEPSGAATTAAILGGRLPLSGPTVVVASGGNIDPALLERLVS